MTLVAYDAVITLPTAPAGPWDNLTKNARAWTEFIRVISNGPDPKVKPNRVRALRVLLDTTWIGK